MDIPSYLLGKKSSGGSGNIDWSAIGYDDTPLALKNSYNYSKEIYDNWDATQTNLEYKFNSNRTLEYMPYVDVSNATNVQYMFYQCSNLKQVPPFNFSDAIVSISGMFQNCAMLVVVPLFNTSKVKNMQYTFRNCYYGLETLPLFDTSNVQNFGQMCENDSYLKNVPLFNTSKATNFSLMFGSCTNLTNESLDNILQMCINATSYSGTKTLRTLIGNQPSVYPTSKIEALPHYQDFIDAGWTIGY